MLIVALLAAVPFAGRASADDGSGEEPPQCGVGDVNNPCAGDGTGYESPQCGVGEVDNPCAGDGTGYVNEATSKPLLPKTGVDPAEVGFFLVDYIEVPGW
ncbi:MAG TPA: hypothetical protein PKE40_05980 [Arachnia sp.]|nr:hypothetical protein [Arachnia sp.]HMT85884.1 hypothetical protein [Arachnia sp.]